MKPTKIGIIGCGNISGAYLSAGAKFEILSIVACADLDMERARAQAAKYHVPNACTVDELLADPEIEIVVNLTIPIAHYDVAKRTLQAGKHVYNEKPLAITREEGQELLAIAREKGLRIGCAPDTFMGGGHQTCRKLIDDGVIGEPIAATAFMICHGHESWHPSPEFYYKLGGGPMFDMGPYYLTALVNMMGSIRDVTGMARITFPERTITSEPKKGTVVTVDVPTHVVGTLEFHNGAIGTIITTFDVWDANLPRIEVYGTKGTLSVTDPNGFGGQVRVKLAGEKEWTDVPFTHGYTENYRSIGVADMAYALRSGRQHRANGEMIYHVLDVMHGIHDAAKERRHIAINSGVARPAPLPLGLTEGMLDE